MTKEDKYFIGAWASLTMASVAAFAHETIIATLFMIVALSQAFLSRKKLIK